MTADAVEQQLAAATGAAGLDAYLVGGAVRDRLLGRDPKDWDLVVCGVDADTLRSRLAPSGRVDSVRVETPGRAGVALGVVWFPNWAPQHGFEVLLARREISTGPGYRDFSFETDPGITLADDLARRDFTCNAVARSLRSGELTDPFGGVADIGARVLRSVTETTLGEDPLRLLRGVARCALDGLTPDTATRGGMIRWADTLAYLPRAHAMPQIRAAIMADGAAHGLRIASQTGVLQQLIPAWAAMRDYDQASPYHELTVDEHSLLAVDVAAQRHATEVVRWTMLLHDIGKPMMGWSRAGEYLPDGRLRRRFHADPEAPRDAPSAHSHEWHSERCAAELLQGPAPQLPLPAEIRDEVPVLCGLHMFGDDHDFLAKSPRRRLTRVRRFLVKHGADRALRLLEVRHCDRAAKHPSGPARDGDRDSTAFAEMVRDQLARGFPLTVGELAISGGALAALGAHGPVIGELQRTLLRRAQTANDPFTFNTAERLEHAALMLLDGEDGSAEDTGVGGHNRPPNP